MEALPAINSELRKQGIVVDDDDGDEPELTVAKRRGVKKSNIEATSEEDSD